MAFFSMRTRTKIAGYGVGAAAGLSAVLLQTTVLSQFPVRDNIPVYCNLPLTLAICWGSISGSPMPPITPDELRLSSGSLIFTRQLLAGSPSGFLMGAFLAALYASMSGFVGDDAMRAFHVFPIYLPFAGFVGGYFCLRHMNMPRFLIMPLVFVISLLAETVMAWQLSLAGRPGVFANLQQIAVHEAALNTMIAPLVYVPAKLWYDFANTRSAPTDVDD
jgi:hypothetical protein